MKSTNSTLQKFGCFFRSATNIFPAYYINCILSSFFLLLSLVSFAGGIKNKSAAVSLKGSSSPLTGTESLRTNLYLLNANNTTILADGVLTEYNNLYRDSVYLEDAYKFTNINENLGLSRYGAILAVERRPIISITDTLFFKLWKTTRRNYQFEFITINLYHPGMQAFLEDAYLGNRTLLALNGSTKINFSINANAASSNVNRFRIIYQTSFAPAPLPVTFTSVKGYEVKEKISIDWKVENEINLDKYEVEWSADGNNFKKVNTIDIAGTNKAYSSYSWIHDHPVSGNNFYRIKSIDRDGSKKFSLIVKVTTGKTGYGTVTIFPNPIKGNVINLHFTNQSTGMYQVRLINYNGQVIYSGRLVISSSNSSQTLLINKKPAVGIYQLEIKAPDNTLQMEKAIVQE